MILRDYQREIFDKVMSANTHDIVQLDTGAGKTPIEAEICRVSEHSILVAHRNVLIVQCSRTLARFGVKHDTVSTEHTRRRCMQAHVAVGKNHIQRGHTKTLVASIDSIIARHKHGRLTLDSSLPWNIIIDEAHHVVPGNKWGALAEIFPNARFIGFTATPGRMDGASLSVKNGGLFNRLVQCGWLRENSTEKLINKGLLCGFALYSPAERISNKSKDAGVNVAVDPVVAYKRHMPGQQAIVMCPAIKNAEEIADDFIKQNISAACINSNMSGTDVWRVISEFSAGKINVLCNVDMVGEGFDVPNVAGLIIARFSKSFIMYRQWIGRVLRVAQNKERAIIVDLVGAVEEHGFPDESIIWDIDNTPKTPKFLVCHPCDNCGLWYSVRDKQCPECGEKNILLCGTSISSNHVTINRLDIKLINSARREIAQDALREKMSNELMLTDRIVGSGLIARSITRLRHSFANALVDAGIKIIDVNKTINDTEELNNPNFWTKYFTVSHADKMPKTVAMRAYNNVKNKTHSR